MSLIINVEKKDSSGIVTNHIVDFNFLKLLKHLASVGFPQKYYNIFESYIKGISFCIYNYHFFDLRNIFNFNFKNYSGYYIDPTQKSHFSNTIGVVLADYLSKEFDNAKYTRKYESVLFEQKLKLKGKRPDLLAFNDEKVFSIESKGYSNKYFGNMAKHKTQASSSKIPVEFSVACVTYDIYNDIKVKYHDPKNDEYKFNNEFFIKNTKNYYKPLDILNQTKPMRTYNIEGRKYITFDIINEYNPFFDYFLFYRNHLNIKKLSLIVPLDFKVLIREGKIKEILNEKQINLSNHEGFNKIYVDKDGIGLGVVNYYDNIND